MSKGEKVISQTIFSVDTLCTLLLHSLIARDWHTPAMAAELITYSRMCNHMYTNRQRADRAARRVLHVAFNHDNSSFYIRPLEEVTDVGNCQERSSRLLSWGCQCTTGNSFLKDTTCTPWPKALPRGDRFPTTTRHRADSQNSTLPALICHRNSFAPHSSAPWQVLQSGWSTLRPVSGLNPWMSWFLEAAASPGGFGGALG